MFADEAGKPKRIKYKDPFDIVSPKNDVMERKLKKF